MTAVHQRPVWLFSMDSDNFYAAPTTTACLKAYYLKYSADPGCSDIELIHFRDADAVAAWHEQWRQQYLPVAEAAVAAGVTPVAGFSFYTWNAAEFLELVRLVKADCPGILVFAGGPHVQQAEDYLFDDPIDLIALGEGEATFQEFLDNPERDNWQHINGLAFLDDSGELIKTPERQRVVELDQLPSPLDVLELTDAEGNALYEAISYETSRGCPFKCAFCEWGTGAIGTKMYQFSMERIRRDWRTIVDAGIKDIWLADSNFGALKDDLEKARLICELKEETGYPSSFATSWSKKHSPRVQEIVMLLNQNGLLPHYQLALQTLTPLALELSNRKNMGSNKYEPIAKQMAEENVPIAAELIWGLPGDNLRDFERNLDQLLATFPNINIFGYTLLPGTEFYRKRDEYRIETIPVAGYGKAKGEYVVGCHTFDRDEGIEGYFLITAHIIFIHGHLLPLTTRLLALEGSVRVSPLLRSLLRAALAEFGDELAGLDINDRMSVYEQRSLLYLKMLEEPQRSYQLFRDTLHAWMIQEKAPTSLIEQAMQTLELDHVLSPRYGNKDQQWVDFEFDANSWRKSLEAMELPIRQNASAPQRLLVETPGGVGDFLKDPDGGSWLKGKIIEQDVAAEVVKITA